MTVCFCTSRIPKFDFTENLSDIKIKKFPHRELVTLIRSKIAAVIKLEMLSQASYKELKCICWFERRRWEVLLCLWCWWKELLSLDTSEYKHSLCIWCTRTQRSKCIYESCKIWDLSTLRLKPLEFRRYFEKLENSWS